MKQIVKLTLSLFLVATAMTTHAQTLDEVISKHIDAYGGPEKIRSTTSTIAHGNLEMQGMQVPIKTWTLQNKAMRMDMEIQGTTNTTVMTANGGWTLFPAQRQKRPVNTDPVTAREGAEELDLTGDLFEYQTKGHTAELLGKETAEGEEMYKIKLTRRTGTVVYLLLNANTFLLSRRVMTKNIQGKKIEITEIFSNYKKTTDGYTYASSMNMQPMGMKINYSRIDFNIPVNSVLFEKP